MIRASDWNWKLTDHFIVQKKIETEFFGLFYHGDNAKNTPVAQERADRKIILKRATLSTTQASNQIRVIVQTNTSFLYLNSFIFKSFLQQFAWGGLVYIAYKPPTKSPKELLTITWSLSKKIKKKKNHHLFFG